MHDLYINHLGIRPNTQETQWVQKPAGIPSFLNLAKFEIHESDIIDFPINFYWEVFNNVFKNGKYIIMVRNPWEVILSRFIRDKWGQATMWDHVLKMHALLLSAPENAQFVFFDDLINNPVDVVSRLCQNLNLDHPYNLEQVMSAKVYPTKYPDNHEDLKNNMEDIPQEIWEKKWIIKKLWDQHGKKFESFNKKYSFWD